MGAGARLRYGATVKVPREYRGGLLWARACGDALLYARCGGSGRCGECCGPPKHVCGALLSSSVDRRVGFTQRRGCAAQYSRWYVRLCRLHNDFGIVVGITDKQRKDLRQTAGKTSGIQ